MNDETPSVGMWFLGAAGAIELLALSGLAWGGPAFPLPAIGIFLIAIAGYAGGAVLTRRVANPDSMLPLIVALGVAMRVVLLPTELRLSDDLWRYLWDGHVGTSGINPYLYPPADAALETIRTTWHALINNPTVPTIYGPVAQFAFRLIQWVGGTVLSVKVVWTALDLVALALLIRLARRSGRPVALVALLYAWSPLLILEVAWSGHLEPLGLVFVVAVLSLSASGKAGWTGAALAGAVMTKFAPIAVAPVVARHFSTADNRVRAPLAFVAGLGAALAVGFLPFLSAGKKLWTGLATYAEHWRFNTGAFGLVERAFADPLNARFAVGLVVVGIVAVAAWKRFDPERAFLWVLGAGIALSPTVHPWYVLWMLPVAALRRSAAWLYLSCSVFLAYWGLDAFHATGEWPEPAWVRAVVWAPFFALLIVEGYRGVASKRGGGTKGGPRHPDVSAGEQE